jgi:uncharacterized protein (UPF0210 family)
MALARWKTERQQLLVRKIAARVAVITPVTVWNQRIGATPIAAVAATLSVKIKKLRD